MNRSRMSRIIPVILVIVVITIAIFALISIGRALFGGDGAPDDVATSKTALLNTNPDRAVSMIVRGKIVANEDFRTYQITVTPTDRTITVYKGYLGDQLATDRLGNNTKAYQEFVNALDRAKMMDGREFVGERNNTLGICATGNLYEFQILTSYQVDKSLWTTNCSGSKGSLNASQPQLQNLFVAQIPSAQRKMIQQAGF